MGREGRNDGSPAAHSDRILVSALKSQFHRFYTVLNPYKQKDKFTAKEEGRPAAEARGRFAMANDSNTSCYKKF